MFFERKKITQKKLPPKKKRLVRKKGLLQKKLKNSANGEKILKEKTTKS